MRVVFLLHYTVFVLFAFLSLFLVSGFCALQCGKIEERNSELRQLNTSLICIDIAIKSQCTL